MKHTINIRGVLIPNNYKWYYDFFGEDSTCPADVQKILDNFKDGDDIEIYINSPGGVIDVGSEIYTMLRGKKDSIKIYITGEACSAASIVAMAGYCEMSPTALMMVHCVSTRASGNHTNMEHTAEMLRAADKALSTAYTFKSGMTEEEVLDMMEHETWLTAEQAKERGLIDGIMFEEEQTESFLVAGPLFALPDAGKMDKVRSMLKEADSDKESVFLMQTKLDLLKLKGEKKMKKKQYEAKRAQLMNEAQQLINEGKAKEAQEKMEEVKALDEQWDAIAQAEANFNALNKEPENKSPILPEDTFTPSVQKNVETVAEAYASKTYEDAWAKKLMGMQLSENESESFKMVNEAFTHTTQNTSIVIPKSVTKGIWEMAGEMYPYFNDVTKTYVKGVLSMIQEDTSSDSGWYEESTPTEDGKETFKEFTLNGCELSRAITVSWKLKEMAIEDFIPYIQRKMAKKMGAAAGYGATHGKGPDPVKGKSEPTGTITALTKEEGTPQVVQYAKGSIPTYKDIINTRSKIKSGYSAGIAIYANSTTIWTKIAAITDANKRPLFVLDLTNGGSFRILGMLVKEDDSMQDGEMLFSNAREGYHLNVNKEITMTSEDHAKERKTDYCGYAIMDGNIVTSKAHALLTEITSESSQTSVPAQTSETGESNK